LENRTRLAREIISRIREELPGLIVATRMNVYDGIPFHQPKGASRAFPVPWVAPVRASWGAREDDPLEPDLSEPLTWIADMVRLGVSLVNVSMGNPYASPHLVRPFEYPLPDGYQPPEHPLVSVQRHFRLTAAVQRAFPSTAVVGSGYSYLQEFLFQAGAANIAAGNTTIVGVGRAALPQPDFAQRLRAGDGLDRRRICRTFSYCTALMRSKNHPLGQFAAGCPPFDKEVYGPIWTEARAMPPGQPEPPESQ
jgi:2,4-dienoyl-CoA reductase-like NADH-dependent reductase (Old Yellow Enzyme family)